MNSVLKDKVPHMSKYKVIAGYKNRGDLRIEIFLWER